MHRLFEAFNIHALFTSIHCLFVPATVPAEYAGAGLYRAAGVVSPFAQRSCVGYRRPTRIPPGITTGAAFCQR